MAGSPFCARPGCQGFAAAWFTYDYTTQRVWLDDVPSGTGGNQWALCAEHARRLRPPRGWEQVDRRGGSGPNGDQGPGLGADLMADADLVPEPDRTATLGVPRRLAC